MELSIQNNQHEKSVLLVEDESKHSTPVRRWLKKDGYTVHLFTTLVDAKRVLTERRFHVAVIDIRLVANDYSNQDGMRLLDYIKATGLDQVMPCIILTSYETTQNILLATQTYNARFLLKEPEYGKRLREELKSLFENKILINFGLVYELGCDNLLPAVASDITTAEGDNLRLPAELLKEQIKDILGKLYLKTQKIFLRKLNPGLTGAAVLRVEPTGEYGLSPAQVLKIGRIDKIRTEQENFDQYVKGYLPFASIQTDSAYSQYLGGILYTFMGKSTKTFEEFDDFYTREASENIIQSLQDLVSNTCRYWYNQHNPVRENLISLYFEALNLNKAKLASRICEILPDYDPSAKELSHPGLPSAILNPLAWMEQHNQDFILPVYRSITHGDLTGRNIMVDREQNCWLIDFYRTYPSHILRDFLILETDIKYRLMPCPNLDSFHELERSLMSVTFLEPEIQVDEKLSPELQKAARVVHALHHITTKISMSVGGAEAVQEEYLRSLLIATLNVVRLRHIPAERKMQALFSSHLICQQLESK